MKIRPQMMYGRVSPVKDAFDLVCSQDNCDYWKDPNIPVYVFTEEALRELWNHAQKNLLITGVPEPSFEIYLKFLQDNSL